MADSIKIITENTEYTVIGGTFYEMLAAIKDIPGRKFNSAKRAWTIPASLEVVRETLEAKGYEVHGEADQERFSLENAVAAQAYIREHEAELREMTQNLRYTYDDYSFRSRSAVKEQIGRRISLLEFGLANSTLSPENLDQRSRGALIKVMNILKGNISNPSYGKYGKERPK